MSTAVILSERNINIQLLLCFEFLKEIKRFPYPQDFKLAVLKQCLVKKSGKDSFGFKIYKTFEFDKKSVHDMYRIEPEAVRDYLSFMSKYPKLQLLLQQLPTNYQENSYPDQNNQARPANKDLFSNNTFEEPLPSTSLEDLLDRISRNRLNLKEMYEIHNDQRGFEQYLKLIAECDGKLTFIYIKKYQCQ